MWNYTWTPNEITLAYVVRYTLLGLARRRNTAIRRNLRLGECTPYKSVKIVGLSSVQHLHRKR